MNPNHLLVLGLATAAIAQSPAPATKAQIPTAPLATPAAEPSALDAPLYDVDADGTVYAGAASFKASFGADGVRFLPFLGSDLPENRMVHFAPAEVRLAGAMLPTRGAAADLQNGTVTYARGAFRESYRIDRTGIEQVYTFDALPTRGDLAFAIHTDGNLTPAVHGTGLAFTHERGLVTYTQAVAIDAHGARLQLDTTIDGDVIRFTVPAAFVAQAALPLVVDPLIGTYYISTNYTYTVAGKDIAYDESAGEWQLMWSRPFSQTDHDVYVQRLDANLTPLGQIVVDQSVDDWRSPSIANLALANRFLVVAHEVPATTTTHQISARMTDVGSNSPNGAQFLIEGTGVAGSLGQPAVACDVGGDPGSAAPTYWTVVFESQNGQNSDIYARQVTSTGTLRGTAPTAVANTPQDEINPRISKSNGRGNFSTQAWAVVYNYDWWIIRGRSLTWNGLLIAPEQELWIGTDPTETYDVSSPTDDENGQRSFLTVVGSEGLPQNGVDIIGRLTDRTMTPSTNPISLSDLALTTSQNQSDQFAPTVDSDGVRFVVTFTHTFSLTDHDIYAAVFQPANVLGGLGCVQTDQLDVSGSDEGEPAVCAMMAGGGGRLRYLTAWDRAVTGGSMILAGLYDGRQEGAIFATRSTGCGNVGINATGLALAGETFTMNRTGPGFGGFAIGTPVSTVIPGCPGCLQGASGSTFFGNSISVTVPRAAGFVGLTFAFQAFDLAGGNCYGQVAVSDTIDATIR